MIDSGFVETKKGAVDSGVEIRYVFERIDVTGRVKAKTWGESVCDD